MATVGCGRGAPQKKDQMEPVWVVLNKKSKVLAERCSMYRLIVIAEQPEHVTRMVDTRVKGTCM